MSSYLNSSAPSLASSLQYAYTSTIRAFQSWANTTTSLPGNASTEVEAEEDSNEPLDLAARMAAIFVPIFFGIIICVGLVGNSLVITVMTKIYKVNSQRLNNTNRFILNLAISDVLFLCFCVPFHATVYTLEDWPFGGFLCVFAKVCEEMTKIASVYTLVALSADRFLAVVYATSARQIRTRANALRGLIFIWIAAAGLAVPTLFTRVYIIFKGHKLCIPSDIHWGKWYGLCLTLFGYVLPLLVITGCYTGLLFVMCRTARKSSVTVSNSSNDSRKKVTKIVVMVVILFAINWMPHHIMSIWIEFFNDSFVRSAETIPLFSLAFRVIAHCMAYANSCVNPLVYAFVSKKFRQDFKKAFTCQYISEAVGSMKAFSRRMIGTVRYSMQSSSNSTADGQVDGGNGRKKQGHVSRAILRNQNICPRSPLTPLSGLPNSRRDRDFLDDESTAVTKVTGFSTIPMKTSEQSALMDDNGCAFDDDEERQTNVL